MHFPSLDIPGMDEVSEHAVVTKAVLRCATVRSDTMVKSWYQIDGWGGFVCGGLPSIPEAEVPGSWLLSG